MFKRAERQIPSVKIDIHDHATAEQIEIATDIRAMEERLRKIPSWSVLEIVALLEGAATAALKGNDVKIARGLYNRANELFLRDAQVRNRNWYVLSMLFGVVGVAAIGALLLYLAQRQIGNLAAPNVILSLFAFAAMGSATSILTRLSSLDLREETSRKFVVYSAISRPFVAISFASVIYIVLKYEIISIQLGGNTAAPEAKFWIAAFLCGFSERFASDILGRFIPSANPK